MNSIKIKYQNKVADKLKVRVMEELEKEKWEENFKQDVQKPLSLEH